MKKMMRCVVCGSYTLKQSHCGELCRSAHPPRFNENDPYGQYRRIWKGIC